MKLKKLFLPALALMVSAGFTSCLDDGDDPTVGTGQDFANVLGYTTDGMSFNVETVTDSYVNLYTSGVSTVDREKFPVGSRVFITYNMAYGQDTSLPVKVSLLSINPVSVIPVDTPASPDECKLDYKAIRVNSCYLAGNYLNLAMYLNTDEKRTWKCLLDTKTSTDAEADLYLITESTAADNAGSAQFVSIDVRSLKANEQYRTIRLHVNCTQGADYVINVKLRD